MKGTKKNQPQVRKETLEFKDSGNRSEFQSGAVRDLTTGKGRMDLLPFRAITWLAKIYETGSKKYGDRNWEKGIPVSRYADSAMRHHAKFMIGELDEPHLAMAFWNIACLLDTMLRIKAGQLPPSLWDLPFDLDEMLAVYDS